ncbi:hypothetical protein [Mycolicibacterium fortuitum]|uniref:hypothetical protein n=1 Tax=Mycolicibacterium fortuitum TaxID=1766 RepID=UPI003AAD1027
MNDDPEQDDVGVEGEPVAAADHRMVADAGIGVSSSVLVRHVARIGEELVGRHPALGFDVAAAAARRFDFTKLAGIESVSERVSAAAKSWMASAGAAHGALTAAAAAGAAFKFDGIASTPAAHDAMKAIADRALAGPLTTSGADLIGRYPGLDAMKGYDFTKLPGMDPYGVSGGFAAALKVHDGVGRLSGVQAAMNALAGPGLKGLLDGDHLPRFGMDWAPGELGRHLHGLTDLIGARSAIADHMSIFDKVMSDSQRAMHESMSRWTSSMAGPAAWMTEAMRGWSTLADGGHWAARLALRMALSAKRAVMRGDIDAVKRFLCDWLGFTAKHVTPDLVGSASLVLLDEPAWLPDDSLALDYDPIPTLRKLTLAEHRNCTRMITDPRRRANHQPVISLNKPITTTGSDSGSPTSLLELVAAKPQPELVAANDDIRDPRVLRVLAKLTDRERRIAEEQGHVGTTWAEAAVACGGTPDEGEKVRRKVKRLSKTATGPVAARCGQRPDAGRRKALASQAAAT